MPAPQKIRCIVDRIVAHGDRVYTVALRPERPVPRFRAGQFLHLTLEPYDPTSFWPDSRAFSIASSPSGRDAVRITYSVHGPFTERMERDLSEGRQVWIKMPYGDFAVDSRHDTVLFAGGTGITAFTAFLEDLTMTEGCPVTLAYGARTNRLLIYRDLVEQCAKRVRSLDAIYFVEDVNGDASAAPVLGRGRISVEAVWPRLERPSAAHFYLSGPPPMLRDITEDLRARDISPEAIHIDAWE